MDPRSPDHGLHAEANGNGHREREQDSSKVQELTTLVADTHLPDSRSIDRDSREDSRRSHRDRRSPRDRSDKERPRSRDRERRRERPRGPDRERERDRDKERRDRRDRPREPERPRHRSRSLGRGSRHREEVRELGTEAGRDSEVRRGRRGSRSTSRRRSKSRSITPLHKKKRKLQLWDVRPVGYEGMTAEEVKATGHFPLPGQITALKLAGALGGPGDNSFPTPFSHVPHAAAGPAAQNLAILRQQRRIYVGNIPYAITEPEIAEFFNNAMVQLKLSLEPGNPVSSVSINHEKNYAFVEFRNHEEATSAMSFDRVSFRSQELKVRRPKDYVPPSSDPGASHTPGVVPGIAQESPYKIFIGGLPSYFSEDQVVELLKNFGELKSFNLVKDVVTGMSKGFAFCEYQDPNMTDVACEALNGMEIGDKKIAMQRATVGAANKSGANNGYPMPQGSNAGFFAPGATTLEPSTVLIFLNMVEGDELEDDEEYADLTVDIKEECGKFGKVIEIRIPRAKDGADPEDVGKIFVKYDNLEDSSLALRSLAGRKFADRTVLGSYYPTDKYDQGFF